MTDNGSDKGNPTYLDRRMEDWLAELVSAESPSEACLPWKALPSFGEAIILPVVTELDGVQDWKQTCLVECIAGIGLAGIATLLELMDHESAAVRRAACNGLPDAMDAGLEIPARSADLLAETLRVLESVPNRGRESDLVRLDMQLSEVNRDLQADEEILAGLLLRLNDGVTAVRVAVIEALGRLRFDDRHEGAIFSAVVCALTDQDHAVRQATGDYLCHAASRSIVPSREDVLRLRCALANRSRFAQKTAATLLRTLPGGPHAPERMLRPIDREPDERTAEEIVEAINQALVSGPAPQVADTAVSSVELRQRLSSSSAVERACALKLLQGLQEDIELMEDDILLSLHDPDIAVRLEAIAALDAERNANPMVAWNLLDSLADSCLHVARAAQFALTENVLKMSVAHNLDT